MKLAIIADVHSNLHALDAVIEAINDVSPDIVACAGDIVGYGAFPNECCKKVKAFANWIVVGNHDLSALTGDTTWMNPYAAAASDWTSRALSEPARAFLDSLEIEARFKISDLRASVFHGSPTSVEEYVYENGANEKMLSDAQCELLILGHTHVPYVKKLSSGLVVNPGSVGQPRDGDPRASYAVFDSESAVCTVHRIDYDIESAYDAIISAGLPEFLASRLFMGV